MELFLVHCQKTMLLWEFILAIVGINLVFPSSVRHSPYVARGSSRYEMKESLGDRSLFIFFRRFDL